MPETEKGTDSITPGIEDAENYREVGNRLRRGGRPIRAKVIGVGKDI